MKCFQSVQILSFRAHKGDPILEIRKRPSRVKIGTLTLFSDQSQAGHRRPVFENGIVANLLPNLWTIFSHSYLSGTSAFYGRKNIAQFWAGSSNGIILICRSYIDMIVKVNSKLNKNACCSITELRSVKIVHFNELLRVCCTMQIQWNLHLRKPDLRKNLDLRKIVGTTNFLVHKLFDLRKIF